MKVILDTHILIWLLNGNYKIKKAGFLDIINKAIENNSLKIPSICIWEIAMLNAKNRIILTKNFLSYIEEIFTIPGISLSYITAEIAFDSANLPGNFHGDPADRIITSSARILNAILLTFDKKILEYGQKGYVKIIQPKNLKN